MGSVGEPPLKVDLAKDETISWQIGDIFFGGSSWDGKNFQKKWYHMFLESITGGEFENQGKKKIPDFVQLNFLKKNK